MCGGQLSSNSNIVVSCGGGRGSSKAIFGDSKGRRVVVPFAFLGGG